MQKNRKIKSEGTADDPSQETSRDPKVHSQHIQNKFSELIDHLRKDVNLVDDPRFGALLETSAEVLAGLKAAFGHFDEAKERAWRR